MESEARKLCDLGKAFLDRGEPEQALHYYERAIDVDPESPDGWCGRGKASYDLGRLERADRDFRRALRLARRALGTARTPRPGARRWWSDTTTRPYLLAMHGHGLCRFWLGNYEDAARIFRRLLRLAPTDPLDVRFLVGETYLRMGRVERAVRELSRVEDDPDALYNLGLTQFYAGDFVSSVNAFRRGFFANLYLPSMLCEKPREDDVPDDERDDDERDIVRDEAGREGGARRGGGDAEASADESDDEGGENGHGVDDGDASHPTDSGTHPKGLDGENAAHDYLDRCGDFWLGRPTLQRWLDEIRHHALVQADVEKHLAQLKALQNKDLAAGERARLEGENTTLRSAERLSHTDRKIAADVLAKVFSLPPVEGEKRSKKE